MVFSKVKDLYSIDLVKNYSYFIVELAVLRI